VIFDLPVSRRGGQLTELLAPAVQALLDTAPRQA
jgi:hypothetical protein